MKKILLCPLFLVFFGIYGSAKAVQGSINLTSDTRSVVVSTIPTSPTKICTFDSNITRTWIINPSSYTLYIATSNVSFSTVTSFGLGGVTVGASAQPVIWSPDGVNAPWQGQLYAVWGATNVPPAISVFRSK